MKLFKAFFLGLMILVGVNSALVLSTAYLEGDTTQNARMSGSTQGGTGIIIKASGLVSDVMLYKIFVGDIYPCSIPAEGIQAGFISCKTTAISTNSDLKGLSISVYYSMSAHDVPGATFDYLVDSTPLLHYVYPLASPPESMLYFFGQHRVASVGDGLRSTGDVHGLYIGDAQCSMLDIPQPYVGNVNSFDKILCHQSKTLEGGKYKAHEEMVVGKSFSIPSIEPTRFAGEEYYEHIVVPTVESVFPSSGLPASQILTITGTGFSSYNSNNEVTVDGVPCAVTDSTSTSITCTRAAMNGATSTLLSTDASPQVNGWIKGSGFSYTRYDYDSRFTTYSSLKTALDAGTSLTVL